MILAAAILIVVVGAGAFALTVRIQRQLAPVAPAAPTFHDRNLAREPENVVERLVVVLKEKKLARVGLSALSFVLLLGAAGVIGYPFYTNLYQGRLQGQLDRQLASPELRDAYLNRRVAGRRQPHPHQDPPHRGRRRRRRGHHGLAHSGPAPATTRARRSPARSATSAIAGHRTTYGRPFHDLDLLQPGDRIILETPIGECTYEVAVRALHRAARPQTEVVANTPDQARLPSRPAIRRDPPASASS